jgi:hypothetical protein
VLTEGVRVKFASAGESMAVPEKAMPTPEVEHATGELLKVMLAMPEEDLVALISRDEEVMEQRASFPTARTLVASRRAAQSTGLLRTE